jgi:predicted PurR-regulated permease PerM
MGSAVKVHPLGVVLAVSTGALLAGIPGALFAVPIAASANSIVNTLVQRQWESGSDPVADYHRREKIHHRARHRARALARLQRKEGQS